MPVPGGSYADPPAIVSQFEECFSAIVKKAGEKNAKLKRNEKTNVQDALEIGRLLLRARQMCQVGEWTAALEAQDISRQRASDFMWGAEQPPEEQAKWECIADLRRARDAKSAPHESRTSPRGHTVHGQGVIQPQALQCRECRVRGRNNPDCPDCAAVRGETNGKHESNGHAEDRYVLTGREPGDDTDEEEAAKAKDRQDKKDNGKPTYSDAKIEKDYGHLVRSISDKVVALDLERSAAYKRIRDHLNGIYDELPNLKKEKQRAT